MNQQPVTCKHTCEAQAFRIEIRRLKSTMVHEAAELARLMQHEEITDELHRHIVKIIQRLKAAGLDGK